MSPSIEKQLVKYEDYDLSKEKSLVSDFLQKKSLTAAPGFLDCIKVGDVIEVYSFPEHKQLYANNEFLRLSSYSPEQMQTIPFQKLFWRESAVQQSLIDRAVCIVQEQKAQLWNLPPHDLVESLHPRRRTFEMHMGWISPVYDNMGAAVGWASTLNVEYIFEWPATSDLD